ncbi:protein FAR1-RELATED SEQUENCE 1-like [Chenopodium quinoa]|uniref:protein FAR1-RELATED SEQUENCE 1-like n=1 Tax=Chenopodium quinoa TaxID=63459 RepID=UPI000B76C1E8|nr:protein FAR1-RELATED SEQUENCE 1-like [Chenopodium quinoa]
MGLSKKDMYNIVNRKTRLKLKYGDAMAMLDYFHKMTVDNQKNFHMHRVDGARRLKDVMGVDARSRVAYENFGDVKEIPFKNEKRNVVVAFDMEMSDVECVCKHFQCHGILCSHIVKVLDIQLDGAVPEKYVLDRWWKETHRNHTMVKVAYHDPLKTEEVQRYDRAMLAFEPAVLRVMVSDDYNALLIKQIGVMSLRLEEKEGKPVGVASW